MQKTIKKILTEYGPVAAVVYLTLFTLVISGFMLAFQFGWRPESITARVGIFTAAYVATRLTQPLRIIATAAITPVAVRIWERFRARNGTPADVTERL
jgi:hypothetical protein